MFLVLSMVVKISDYTTLKTEVDIHPVKRAEMCITGEICLYEQLLSQRPGKSPNTVRSATHATIYEPWEE